MRLLALLLVFSALLAGQSAVRLSDDDAAQVASAQAALARAQAALADAQASVARLKAKIRGKYFLGDLRQVPAPCSPSGPCPTYYWAGDVSWAGDLAFSQDFRYVAPALPVAAAPARGCSPPVLVLPRVVVTTTIRR